MRWPAPTRRCSTPRAAPATRRRSCYQLLVRSFGTNNLPDCSNMCHESSGTALTESIGIGKGSVTVDDVERADLIIIAGQNPGTNHPRMLSVLEKAKADGAKIIAVNPLPEAGLIRFKDPQKVHGVVGARHPDRRRVRADPARRRHGVVRRAGPAAARSRRPRPRHVIDQRIRRRALRRASTSTRRRTRRGRPRHGAGRPPGCNGTNSTASPRCDGLASARSCAGRWA